MTLLLTSQALSKSFGTRTLFDNLFFSVFSGERIGLIGPNGSGKSTLLKIFAGEESQTSGTVSKKRDLKIGYVPQVSDLPDMPPEMFLQQFAEGVENPELQAQIWLSKLGFTGDESSCSTLSGGWKKRLSLAAALMTSPDLLLLDEPTNHLDLEGILWLEKFLKRESSSYILVSHDRTFLQKMTSRVIEINPSYPGGLFSVNGPYLHFLEKKEQFLLGQLETERSLASKARHEQEWLRKSPKARTTKAQSRVDDAHELLDELSSVKQRNRQKRADITFSATERETQKLLVSKNLSKRVGDRLLFEHLDFTLSPGTKMGLMGPNGSGKTTLLRIIADELSQDLGTIKKADDLKIVYFDQHRVQLPLHLTLKEALAPDGDFVDFRGQKIHVNGWCKRFLFSPDTLKMPLEKLSGGERARISIAHLMLQPADLLLLDEPTNDLDIPTLETLEESLMDFPGAVILITHDRSMLARLCNTFLAFGRSTVPESFVDYHQWEEETLKTPASKSKEQKAPTPSQKPRLSYAEKKEFEQIERKISDLEKEIKNLNRSLETLEVSLNPERLQQVCSEIGLLETQVEQLYLRWQELEKKANFT